MSDDDTEMKVGEVLWRDLTVENAEEIRDFYHEVVGWKATPEDMEGEDLFNPKSDERVFYFEAYRGVVDSQKGELFHLKVSPIRYGLLKGKMKLIYDGKYEAYDIEKDFFESQNIYRNPDSEMAVLSGMLTEFRSNVKDFIEYSKKYFKQRSKLTKEEIEKLKSLGYIKK